MNPVREHWHRREVQKAGALPRADEGAAHIHQFDEEICIHNSLFRCVSVCVFCKKKKTPKNCVVTVTFLGTKKIK